MGRVFAVGLTVVSLASSGAMAGMIYDVPVTFDPSVSSASLNLGVYAGGSVSYSVQGYAWNWVQGKFVPNGDPIAGSWNPHADWGTHRQISNPGGNAKLEFDVPTLANDKLEDLYVDIKGNADWSVNESWSGSLAVIPGVFEIGFDLSGSAGIDALYWQMTPGQPANGIIDPDGSVGGLLSGSIGANFKVKLGALPWMSVWNPSYSLDLPIGIDAQLTGALNLTDLNPDVGVNVNASLPSWSPASFSEGNSWSGSTYIAPFVPYYTINVSWGIGAGVEIETPRVELNGPIENIIPEPISLAVFGLGGGMLTLLRRRSR